MKTSKKLNYTKKKFDEFMKIIDEQEAKIKKMLLEKMVSALIKHIER